MQLPFIVRFVITIYDAIILFFLFFIISIPLVIFFDLTTRSPWYPLYLASLYVISFLYYGGMWTLRGHTPAMKLWKTTIKNKKGEAITWKQATIRYLVALISWVAVGIGFIWMFFRKDRATWHDLASGTNLYLQDKNNSTKITSNEPGSDST